MSESVNAFPSIHLGNCHISGCCLCDSLKELSHEWLLFVGFVKGIVICGLLFVQSFEAIVV